MGTFIDRASVLSSRADRPEWPKALAAVEVGPARGIVAPSMVMVRFHPEDRDSLAAWQATTGAFVSTPGTLSEFRRRPAETVTGR
ncbi:hypothetical protein ABZY09_39765 [Streptomyces sp. NPDC002928]|uniref:hypothetical protein n=1 Tax=Streptomyces sp. NPDC002928 TaxID=3154440 RepID=UPI0033B2E0AF